MLKKLAIILLAATVTANGHAFSTRAGKEYHTAAFANITSPSARAIIKFVESNKAHDLVGVIVKVKGLKAGVSYPYHIHEKPVPASGNCTLTGGHLDPAKIKVDGKPYKCDAKNAAKTCELGDLAGRHGNIVADEKGRFSDRYIDRLINKRSVVGRSIVIHGPDNSRIACANIMPYKKGDKPSKSDPQSESSSSESKTAAPSFESGKSAVSDSAYASIATGVESKRGGAASLTIPGAVALVAAAFAF